MDMWILGRDGEPSRTDDIEVWTGFMKDSYLLKREAVDDETEVSTVFLGMDHNFVGNGPPILWETLVFGGHLDGEMDRYTSEADALNGHDAMLARVRIDRGTPSVRPACG